jgi:hypothetical protein
LATVRWLLDKGISLDVGVGHNQPYLDIFNQQSSNLFGRSGMHERKIMRMIFGVFSGLCGQL